MEAGQSGRVLSGGNFPGGNIKNTEQDSKRFPVSHPALLALVAVTILLRMGLSFILPRVIRQDEAAYLKLGYNLLAGNGFTYSGYPELHFPPLHPIVAGLFHWVTGNYEIASNLEYALFGGLLLFPVFAIAQRIYGVRTAWVAAVLLAIFPALTISVLYWGSLTEPMFLFLTYAGSALLLAGLEEDRLWMFGGAGALLGLAYLTRPEGVVFFGVFLILSSLWLWRGVNICVPKACYALGLYVLPFVLLAAPYVWYLHFHTGLWMISGKINSVWKTKEHGESPSKPTFGLDSSGKEINWLSPDRFRENNLPKMILNPRAVLDRMMKNVRNLKDQFFSATIFWWGLTPLVFIALFREPWHRRRVGYEVFLFSILLSTIVAILPFFFVVRLFAPVFPVLLIWTARGALDLGTWLQDTVELWRREPLSNVKLVLSRLPTGMVIGFLLLMNPIVAQGWISETFFGDKETGLWLKAHSPADANIMAVEITPALYGERVWVPLPKTDWTRFLKYAREHDANYLVLLDYKLPEVRPDLAFIPLTGAPELELVFTFEESHMPKPFKTLVYRFLKPSPSEEQSSTSSRDKAGEANLS